MIKAELHPTGTRVRVLVAHLPGTHELDKTRTYTIRGWILGSYVVLDEIPSKTFDAERFSAVRYRNLPEWW